MPPEIKIAQLPKNKKKLRHAAVMLFGETKLTALSSLTPDVSLLFMAQNRPIETPKKIISNINSLSLAHASPVNITHIKAQDVSTLKQLINNATHDFLSGQYSLRYKGSKTQELCYLLCLHELQNAQALLFTCCINSTAHTNGFLSNPSHVFNTLKSHGVSPYKSFYMPQNNSGHLMRTLSITKMMSGSFYNLLQDEEKYRQVLKEKNSLQERLAIPAEPCALPGHKSRVYKV